MTSAALATSYDFIQKNFNFTESRVSSRFIEIELSHDSPLFGFAKDEKVLVDTSAKPTNGNLVVLAKNDTYEVYRYETARGEPTLWPSNRAVGEAERNSLFVLMRESGEQPFFDVALYF